MRQVEDNVVMFPRRSVVDGEAMREHRKAFYDAMYAAEIVEDTDGAIARKIASQLGDLREDPSGD